MRVAYVSHVDSRWIKQRPHFLAEALGAQGFAVTYVCSLFARRRALVLSQRLRVKVCRLPLMPQRLRKYVMPDVLAGFVCAVALMVLVRPQAIVVTHVRHYWMARFLRLLFKRTIFYDCMDRNAEFADVAKNDVRFELSLRERASGVFCSSDAILRDLESLRADGIYLVNNALAEVSVRVTNPVPAYRPRRAMYVGTVSDWFDFDAVEHLLASEEDAVVEIVGPADVPIPQHPRLIHRGVLEHSRAMEEMRCADVLIMPFRVNRLIEAVDPVKAYEYVASGRPAVCVDYPQLDHFGHYIRRYSGPEGFVEEVRRSWGRPSLDVDALTDFVSENSWAARADVVAEVIRDALGHRRRLP